jgi:hypothetical protein
MIRDNIRKNLDKIIKVFSVLCFVALLFAIYVSIQYARKRTKGEIIKKETYFNHIHQHFNKDWSKNAYWDDHTEHNQYAVNMFVDSVAVNVVYTYDLRKQKFNDQFSVKTSDEKRPDVFEIMNLNIFPATGDDSSTFMLSEYFLRMNPLVIHKMSLSFLNKNEGMVFKTYKNNQSVIKLNYDSYQDGEGIGEKVFEKDVLFEDQLFYTLRSLKFADGLKFNAKVLETQIGSSVGKFVVYNATFTVSDAGQVKAHDCWKVLMTLDSGTSVEYYFDKEFPNTFYQLKASDGESVQLIEVASGK